MKEGTREAAAPSPAWQEKMGSQAPPKVGVDRVGVCLTQESQCAPLEATGCVIIHYICLKCEFKQNHKLGYAKKARVMVLVSAWAGCPVQVSNQTPTGVLPWKYLVDVVNLCHHWIRGNERTPDDAVGPNPTSQRPWEPTLRFPGEGILPEDGGIGLVNLRCFSLHPIFFPYPGWDQDSGEVYTVSECHRRMAQLVHGPLSWLLLRVTCPPGLGLCPPLLWPCDWCLQSVGTSGCQMVCSLFSVTKCEVSSCLPVLEVTSVPFSGWGPTPLFLPSHTGCVGLYQAGPEPI